MIDERSFMEGTLPPGVRVSMTFGSTAAMPEAASSFGTPACLAIWSTSGPSAHARNLFGVTSCPGAQPLKPTAGRA